MKIAYLLGSLSRGGTETLLLDVFRTADKANYDFIGVHRKDGPYKDDFYATKPTFVQCAPKGKNLFGYLRRLRNLLKKENITIAHAQQSIDAVYAILATWGTKIKVVQTFHGYDFGTKGFTKRMIKWSIKHSDAVCFVSEAQKQYYIKEYKLKCHDKLHVVYNGINFSKLDVEKAPLELPVSKSDRPQGGQKPLKLAMVGNFVPGRAQNSACQFLKKIKDTGAVFDFYFVGKKSEAEPWRFDNCVQYCQENGLSDCVHFLGGRGDVPQILKHMDAFIYATDHYTFGIAVIEAIAAGLPTFVNDWEVMTEVTGNGKWASVYKTNDAEDFCAKFMDFVANIDQYKNQATSNAQQVRAAYSIEQHMQRLYQVYSDTLS
jgi:glycosyltransferase involved in cell wall biosynthesis